MSDSLHVVFPYIPKPPLPHQSAQGLWDNRASSLSFKFASRCSSCVFLPIPAEPGNILLTSVIVTQVLSPTYKQRNEDFRKLFKQLPDTERLIVGEPGDLGAGGGSGKEVWVSQGQHSGCLCPEVPHRRASPSENICLGAGRVDRCPEH